MTNAYKSWGFTVRPKNGVEKDSKLENAILTWCKKQDFHFLCAEGEEECRHLHGQIWLDNPREKGEVQKALQRIYERIIEPSPAEIKVLRSGVKIAYSKDFVENYLSKEDSWISLDPPCDEEKYYPSKEEQEKVKNSANAVDKKYHRYSEMFKETYKEYKNIFGELKRKTTIAKWLGNQMFKEKTIPVIADKKHRTQLLECLKAYIWEESQISMWITEKDYQTYQELSELVDKQINQKDINEKNT